MRQALIFLGLGLLGGFAVSAWWSTTATDVEPTHAMPAPDTRGAARERGLAGELEDLRREVAALRADVRRLEDVTAVVATDPAGGERPLETPGGDTERFEPPAVAAEAPPGDLPFPPPERFRMRSAEGRLEALTQAGFALDRAQQIERRVEELRLEAMQARYEAARNGGSANGPIADVFDTNATLRAELGDADYERYLSALGQSTRVDVFNVLASSAAEQAGIEPGDQIVAYGGQRVFDVRELNQAVLVGEPGEPVVVDIVRAGQPMQLVLPRGPIGISGGFARRRGP